jgi:hypothetical protein
MRDDALTGIRGGLLVTFVSTNVSQFASTKSTNRATLTTGGAFFRVFLIECRTPPRLPPHSPAWTPPHSPPPALSPAMWSKNELVNWSLPRRACSFCRGSRTESCCWVCRTHSGRGSYVVATMTWGITERPLNVFDGGRATKARIRCTPAGASTGLGWNTKVGVRIWRTLAGAATPDLEWNTHITLESRRESTHSL